MKFNDSELFSIPSVLEQKGIINSIGTPKVLMNFGGSGRNYYDPNSEPTKEQIIRSKNIPDFIGAPRNIGGVVERSKVSRALNAEINGVLSNPSTSVFNYINTRGATRAQRTITAWENMVKNVGMTHLSLDIENLGVSPLAKNQSMNLFAMTEVGLSSWQFNGLKSGSPMLDKMNTMTLAGFVDEKQKVELKNLIKQVESTGMAGLTDDHRRTLWWLMRYQDSEVFKTETIPGIGDVRLVNKDKLKSPSELPDRSTFTNLKAYTSQMRNGLKNLYGNGNSGSYLDGMIKAINHHVENIAKNGGNLMGYNFLEHDIPAMMEYFNQTRTALGPQSPISSSIETLMKNLHIINSTHRALDVNRLIDLAYHDPIGQIAPLIGDKKMREHYKTLSGGIRGKQGLTTLEVLSNAFNNRIEHFAGGDAEAVPMLLNSIGGNINSKIASARRIAAGASISLDWNAISGGVLAIDNKTIKSDSSLFSISGLSPYEKNKYDGIYKLDDTGKFIDAYSDNPDKPISSGNLYKNTEYRIHSFKQIEKGALEGFEHGGWALTLRNVDEGLYHTFVRPENISGTGFDSIRSIFSHLVPYNAEHITGVSGEETRTERMKDRALRAYYRIFDTDGGHVRAERYMRALDAIDKAGVNRASMDDLTKGQFKDLFNSEQQARNFYYMQDRLRAERGMINAVISSGTFQSLKGVQKDFALTALQDIMEGRVQIPDLRKATGGISPAKKVIKTTTNNRMLQLSDNIVLNLGSYKGIVSQLRQITKRPIDKIELPVLINKLGGKHILDRTEVTNFLRLSEIQKQGPRESNFVLKQIAAKLFDRTRIANDIVSGMKIDDIQAKNLANEFLSYKVAHVDANNGGIWEKLTPDQMRLVANHALDEGQRRGSSAWQKIDKAFVPNLAANQEFAKMLEAHNAIIHEQLSPLKRLGPLFGLNRKAEEPIKKLLSRYLTDANIDGTILSSPDNKGFIFALYDEKKAATVGKQTVEQIMNNSDVVKVNIPLVDERRILTVGRVMRINQMDFTLDGKNIGVETSFDKILQSQVGISKRVKEAMLKGDYAQAQALVNWAQNKVLKDLSGANFLDSDEVMDTRKIRNLSHASIRQRSEVIYFEGIKEFLAGKDISGLNLTDSVNLNRTIAERLSVKLGTPIDVINDVLNPHTLKEAQFTGKNGRISRSVNDIRQFIPFGYHSSAATMRMTQAENIHPFHPKSAEALRTKYSELANPLLMTEAGKARYGVTGNNLAPWVTVKTAYMDDNQVQKMIAEAERTGAPLTGLVESTYDARAFMRGDIANDLLKMKMVNEYVVSDINKEILASIEKGDPYTIAPSEKPFTIGQLVESKIVDGEGNTFGVLQGDARYNKKQPGVVNAITKLGENKYKVSVERTLPAANGLKLITSSGDKMTLTLVENDRWNSLFGAEADKLHLVMGSQALKHGGHGDIISSQVRAMVNEVQNQITTKNLVRNKVEDDVIKVLNNFFGNSGFKFEDVPGSKNKMLVMINNPKNQVIDHKLFKTQVLDKVSDIIGSNLTDKLLINVAGVGNIMTGYENVGAQPIEPWFKAVGSEGGIYKIGPKEIGMFRLNGLTATAKEYEKMVREQAGVDLLDGAVADKLSENGRIEAGKKEVKSQLRKYERSINSLTGMIDSRDTVIHSQTPIGETGEGRVSLSSFKRFLRSGDVKSDIDYTGTWYDDIEKIANNQVHSGEPGALTPKKAEKILSRGGAVFELPFYVTAGDNIINKVFLPIGQPRKLGVAQMPQANELLAASGRVIRTLQDIATLDLTGKEASTSLQKAMDHFTNVNIRGVSDSKGLVYNSIESARLQHSGQFLVQTFSPGQKKAAATAEISLGRLREMTKGMKKGVPELLEELALGDTRELQEKYGVKGLPGIVGRYPTEGLRSIEPTWLRVNEALDRLAPHAIQVTVGDAVAYAADNDGDFMSTLLAHFKGKTRWQIESQLRSGTGAIGEIAAHIREIEPRRQFYDELVSKLYEADNRKSSSASYGDWVKAYTGENIDLPKAELQTVGSVARAELEARLGRSYIGYSSNVATSMRKMAEIAMRINPQSFDLKKAQAVTALGELVTQSSISSKHFSKSALDDHLAKTIDEWAGIDSAGQEAERNKLLDKRISSSSEMVNAMIRGDRETFIEHAKIVGAMDVDATDMEEYRRQAYSGGIKGSSKFAVRQIATVYEGFGAVNDLKTVMGGDLEGVIHSATNRMGVSSGIKNLNTLVDVLNGNLSGEAPTSSVTNVWRILHGEQKAEELERKAFERAEQRTKWALDERASSNMVLNSAYADQRTRPDMVTVGEQTMRNIFRDVEHVAGGSKLAGAGWGAGAFAGLMMVGNMFADPLPKDMMPQPDQAPPIDGGGYIPTPDASPGGPVARITQSGEGYENLQVMIRARDANGLSNEQIGQLVQGQISSAMPVNMNMNITSNDNTQRIDNMWVQSVVTNALTKGQAF